MRWSRGAALKGGVKSPSLAIERLISAETVSFQYASTGNSYDNVVVLANLEQGVDNVGY